MNKENLLNIKKLHPDAQIPESAYGGDVGLDLYCVTGATIAPHDKEIFPTGLAIEFPDHLYGEIRERSGISVKTPLSIKAGIIDTGYRGEIGMVVRNDSPEPYEVEAGTKLAQLIIQEAVRTPIAQVDEFTKSTDRGDRGYGSSDQ